MPETLLEIDRTIESAVAAILAEAGFGSSTSLTRAVVALVLSLDGYAEEGTRLYPEFFVVAGCEKALKTVPMSRRHRFGTKTVERAIPMSLKRCASVAREDWAVYLDVSDLECVE